MPNITKLIGPGLKLIQGATKTRKSWKSIGSKLWKIMDYALTAYAVVDIFAEIGDSDSEEGRSALFDRALDILIPPATQIALSKESHGDIESVIFGFTNAGIALSSEDMDGTSIKGVSYLMTAAYLMESGTSILRSPSYIKTVIQNEFSEFLGEGLTMNASEVKKEVTSTIADIDFSALSRTELRRFDFLVYYMENLDNIDALTSQVTSNNGSNGNQLGTSVGSSVSAEDAGFKLQN